MIKNPIILSFFQIYFLSFIRQLQFWQYNKVDEPDAQIKNYDKQLYPIFQQLQINRLYKIQMLRFREYIDIDVFALDRSKNLDPPTFQHLKNQITQMVQTEKQCHCTICGINLFDTISVFDGYSSFCIGCESRLGEIKRSVYVFVSIGCQEVHSPDVSEQIDEEQEPALIKSIKGEEIPEPQMEVEEERQDEMVEIEEPSPPLPDIIFQPNQEIIIDEEQQKKNRLKTLMLRERHAIFQPLKYQLHFFNDQYFDLAVGFTRENIKEEVADGLMHLMKGWTIRNAMIEKKFAQYYGLNKELKEKFQLQESIELSEEKFPFGSDESSDSQVIIKLRERTEQLSMLAKFYLEESSESK